TQELPVDETAAIRRVASLPAGSNLLRTPLAGLERRMSALPWVRAAGVQWLGPHALKIRVTPRQPAVVALIGDRHYEVDGAGIPVRIARPLVVGRLPLVEL